MINTIYTQFTTIRHYFKYKLKYYFVDKWKRSSTPDVYFYNWWSDDKEAQWLYRFIRTRNIPIEKSLNFFSVFGRKMCVRSYPVEGSKIFFTGEDVHKNAFGNYTEYSNYCLDIVDFAIGFDEQTENKTNYLRFPLWICALVDPTWTYQELKENIDKINHTENRRNSDRTSFMSHIAGHDANGIRTKLVHLFNQIEQVSCAGKLLNNTDELKTVFNDDKQAYLRKFKFNLCPENTSVNGYVTEKCIEAIISGCIPVYWGNESAVIEPEILNQEAILRYTDNNEAELLEKVRALNNSEEAYQAFIEIKPFKDNAAEIIWAKLQQLEKHLTELAREKR